MLFALLALGWLALSLRVKRPGFLLLGVALANAWAWGMTNYPLRSLYGLLTSTDRASNLALVQVVAAGDSPLRTAQAGQLTFEPFWGLLVAALSAFDPERVLALYPFLPLVMAVGFAVTLYWGFGGGGAWSPWERALVAGFATLLSSAPFEYAGTYRVPWAMTFLLKPNHALGLVLFPAIVAAFSRIRGWGTRVAVGLLLHLLGWVFVIHMVYVSAGLLLFAGLSLLERRADAKKDLLDVAVVIGINLLVVSPYLVMLAVGYPFLYPSERAMIPPFSPHLLEASVKQGAVFLLGVWGLVVLQRRGGRLDRVFVAQVLGAYLVWAAYLAASALQLARERDEIYYWVRFLTAAAASVGAWDLGRRAAERWRPGALGSPQLGAAVCLAALPFSLPCWWDPVRMDSYFAGSLEAIPDRLRLPTDFIRRETDPRVIFAGDRDYARFVAALGARRVSLALNLHIPRNYRERVKLEALLVQEADPEVVVKAARAQGVGYLVVTPELLRQYADVRLRDLEARSHFKPVFFWGDRRSDFVAIFRIVGRVP